LPSTTETPDAELDVIDGGFGTVPALGLEHLGYRFGAHRKWKLKDTPVTCRDGVLLASPRYFEIFAGFPLRKNDVAHPDPQRRFVRLRLPRRKRGKTFQPMDSFGSPLGYGSRILPQFQSERGDAVKGLLQASDPIPQRAEIFIVKRQSTNVFIKLDGMPQANFRLFHAARDARVAGKVESDQGDFGMYRLRPQQNGFGLLDALYPSDRIGEIDPPGLVFRLNLHKVAGNRPGLCQSVFKEA
jgi:hypothetical protein